MCHHTWGKPHLNICSIKDNYSIYFFMPTFTAPRRQIRKGLVQFIATRSSPRDRHRLTVQGRIPPIDRTRTRLNGCTFSLCTYCFICNIFIQCQQAAVKACSVYHRSFVCMLFLTLVAANLGSIEHAVMLN